MRWPQAKECWGHQKLEEVRNRLLDFELLASRLWENSFVWNHPVCGYFYLWKSYETGMTTNRNVAYFPGSRKAGKMIAQTEAKLNKSLDEFVEEKQNKTICIGRLVFYFSTWATAQPWPWLSLEHSILCPSLFSLIHFSVCVCSLVLQVAVWMDNLKNQHAHGSCLHQLSREKSQVLQLWKALAFRDAGAPSLRL